MFTAASLSFLPHLIRLALPIALQALMMTVLNLVDTVMVGQLGEVQIGAIALGNQIFFLLMLFLFGVGSGGAVFASQYWGRRDVHGVRRSMAIALIVGVAGATLFTLVGELIPRTLLSLFSSDGAVLDEGTGYLRIVALSYIFTAVSISYAHGLRSIGDTRLPMYATAVSIVLNIVGNYALIFGAFGFPALGVRGAAISTAIARLVEVAIILTVVYRRNGPTAVRGADFRSLDRAFATAYFNRALPVIVNEILWSTGFVLYTVVFGRMGTSFLAAYNISDTVGRLMLVFFIGTGNATAVLIGNMIGAGRSEEAEQVGKTILRLAPIVSGVVGIVVFFVVAPLVPYLFSVSPEVRRLVTQFQQMFAILIVAKAMNIHVIVGILRGGGDTRYALAIDILPLWFIGVPAAFIAGLVLAVPAPMVYLALNMEEITRAIIGWRRVNSGVWVNDLVGEGSGTFPDRFEPVPGYETTDIPPAFDDSDATGDARGGHPSP
ncbi:MAG: MATE family efflux transporter [Alkalispirochaeta sp.]